MRFIYDICRNSSVVPTGRADIWAQGLYYGFDRDFFDFRSFNENFTTTRRNNPCNHYR